MQPGGASGFAKVMRRIEALYKLVSEQYHSPITASNCKIEKLLKTGADGNFFLLRDSGAEDNQDSKNS